jgi:hypothetical protein
MGTERPTFRMFLLETTTAAAEPLSASRSVLSLPSGVRQICTSGTHEWRPNRNSL